MTELKRKAADR